MSASFRKLAKLYGCKLVGSYLKGWIAEMASFPDSQLPPPDEVFDLADVRQDLLDQYREAIHEGSMDNVREMEAEIWEYLADTISDKKWCQRFVDRPNLIDEFPPRLIEYLNEYMLQALKSAKAELRQQMATRRILTRHGQYATQNNDAAELQYGVPRPILHRIAALAEKSELCDQIEEGEVPPIKLLGLASELNIPFDEDTTWPELCRLVSDAIFKLT